MSLTDTAKRLIPAIAIGVAGAVGGHFVSPAQTPTSTASHVSPVRAGHPGQTRHAQPRRVVHHLPDGGEFHP